MCFYLVGDIHCCSWDLGSYFPGVFRAVDVKINKYLKVKIGL